MATRDSYYKTVLRKHEKYEKQMLKLFIDYFQKVARTLPFDMLREDTFTSQIESHVTTNNNIFIPYYELYYKVGLNFGKFIGKPFEPGFKFFDFGNFDTEWARLVTEFILTGLRKRTILVERTFWSTINQIIVDNLNNGESYDDAIDILKKTVNKKNFYRWQAARIVRTETTTAINRSTLLVSDITSFEMEKEWISELDNRTRDGDPFQGGFNHVEPNGQRVAKNDAFNVSLEQLQYPGDPNGSAGNTINCRCFVGLVAKRDADGNLIFKV